MGRRKEETNFVHLHVHSNYTLSRGASTLEELLLSAHRLGMTSLALTDTNALYGALSFYKLARKAGIKPIIGTVLDDPDDSKRYAVLLARSGAGYSRLCRAVTDRQLKDDFSLAECIREHGQDLFVLTPDTELARELAGELEAGSLFVELVHRGDQASRRVLREQLAFAREGGLPVVASNAVMFHDPSRYHTHRVLVAIGRNSTLEALEPEELAHPKQYLRSGVEMHRLFRRLPEALENTVRIARACAVEFALGTPTFPRYPLPEGESPYSYLSKIAFDGLRERYRPITPEALERLQYELSVIDQLGFSEYFLIVWDIVNYARKESIPVVGRGSAADSLVSYCLGITAVDPLAYGLYFERFLNLSRTDCPDIDVDLCWKGRDRVVRYVYDRYGADHVAMIATYNTYKSRSAFREIAKAFGLPPREVSRWSSRLPYYSARGIRDAMVSFPECRDFPIDEEPYRTIVSIAETIDCYPRHLSVHVGGIVISRDPLTEVTPLQEAAKGIVITQLDPEPIEELGLVKIDLLGQRSLSIVADTVKLVEGNYGITIDPERIADGDDRAADVLRHGRTLGCFQIESPGMRNLLVMMGAENRMDVIRGLSLIRPGPASSGMKERFVRRRRGLEKTTFLTPHLRDVLGDTHGVMLYQEDILKVAQAVAGFTLAEGDQLRKAISKERSRERIEALRDRFLRGALSRGVRREAAEAIWKQITNFAGYSYCKAHATTYGHISYSAVWLKARYPAEFLASVLNNQAGFYEPRSYLEEARRWGVTILPLDLNESEVYFTAKDGKLRMGFMAVKGLGERTLRRLIRTRGERAFRSLADFYARVRPQRAEAEALILVGAFDRLGRSRPQLLWELELLGKQRPSAGSESPTKPLWEDGPAPDVGESVPELPEFSLCEQVACELEHLEMTPSAHPLLCYRNVLAGEDITPAAELGEHVGERVRVAGWLAAVRRAPTRNNQFMEFLTLEDETALMEVTLFPNVYQRFGHLVRGYGPYLVEGTVEDQFGAVTLSAQKLRVVDGTASGSPEPSPANVRQGV